MLDTILLRGKRYIENYYALREVFHVSNPSLNYASASLLAATGRSYAAKDLAIGKLLAMRRSAEDHDLNDDEAAVFAALLTANPDGANGLRRAEEIYQLLGERFPESIMLPVSALYIAGLQQPVDTKSMVKDICRLYDRMETRHFRLKPSKLPLLGCMVSTGRGCQDLAEDAECCAEILRSHLRDGVTALSCILACSTIELQEKCSRLMELVQETERQHIELPSGSGLAPLAFFALTGVTMNTIMKDISQMSAFLESNSVFDGVGSAQRNMYAAILVASKYGEAFQGPAPETIMAAHQAAVAADFVRAAYRAGRKKRE